MRTSFPQIASAVALAVAWILIFVWIWALHRQWWHIRNVRRALAIVPAISFATLLLWIVLDNLGVRLPGWLAYPLILLIICAIGLMLTLPISGVMLTAERITRWIGGAVRKRRMPATDRSAALPVAPAPPGSRTDSERRSFLVKAAAAVPAVAVASAGWGVIDSGHEAVTPTIAFTFRDLPPELDGFRILHLSDIHLGPFVDLDYLEKTLEHGARGRPDLVLVTGDVADDLTQLPHALRLIDQLRPRHGTYASIGNHEYYRGIRQVLSSFDHGPIPLLINTGAEVKVGGASLYLGGADDPATMGRQGDNDRFLRTTVERAFDGAPSDAFHLLMSHRPRGFVPAADLGIPMTISGHTHGGIQFGIAGRSPLEPFMREQFLWGHYRRGDAQLYTSAGVGHWLPFRLACPREAPIYVLRRA